LRRRESMGSQASSPWALRLLNQAKAHGSSKCPNNIRQQIVVHE